MSVSILRDEEQGYQCMFCDTNMWAFGGIFELDEDLSDFMSWLPDDPRIYDDDQLHKKICEWREKHKKDEDS